MIRPATFVHEAQWEDLPGTVQNQARRCLLDTLGAAMGGRQTHLSAIVHEFVVGNYGGSEAVLWFDGRRVSAPGAALANGMTVDALDVHDGHNLAKGHAGAALVPAALAAIGLSGRASWSGKDLLAALVVGYEISLRCAFALHQTAADYHTSGAWNAIGSAAIVARRLSLDAETTRHALGIAEYHGPRSPMMRCIDHPAMIKDGSGWGAMAGVSAGLLASGGFTGAPAELVEGSAVLEHWTSLGTQWYILDQYFKPYAVCRWAQPAMVGALELKALHSLSVSDIAEVRVHTFEAAARLTSRRPATTEEAQYSLPFPVAAALIYGRVGPGELTGEALTDPVVLALAERIEVLEDPDLTARFPAQRIARVEIQTKTGETIESRPVTPNWGAESPPSDEALKEKFHSLGRDTLAPDRLAAIESTAWNLSGLENADLLNEVLAPPQNHTAGAEPQQDDVLHEAS